MNFKKLLIGSSLMFALLAVGCAHNPSTDAKIDEQVSGESGAAFGGPLAAESQKLIMESEDLNEGQKKKILSLHDQMMAEIMGIRKEMGKLKMVFFKTVLNPGADEREINNLKTRILALDRKKTNRMLSALEELRVILGRSTLRDDRLFRAFSTERIGGGGAF